MSGKKADNETFQNSLSKLGLHNIKKNIIVCLLHNSPKFDVNTWEE